MGGVALWVAIFPFDVIKSRVQISNTTEPMIKMLFRIARTEGKVLTWNLSEAFIIKCVYVGVGIMSLYNGLGPTVIRTFPGTGALFLAYETSRKVLNDFLDN